MTLDIALGGGYPRGRVIEIYGPESSGKTTLALHALAEVQKTGGVAAFIDAEHALDPAYADRLGVDVSELLVSQPDSGGFGRSIGRSVDRPRSIHALAGARLYRHGVFFSRIALLHVTSLSTIYPTVVRVVPCEHVYAGATPDDALPRIGAKPTPSWCCCC